MLSGVAVMAKLAYGGVRGPRYIPYGWVYVVVVIALIALIFMRVYARGDRSRGAEARPVRTADCTPRQSRVRTRRKLRTSGGIQTTTGSAVTGECNS